MSTYQESIFQILLARSDVAGWGAFLKVKMFVLVYFKTIKKKLLMLHISLKTKIL